MHRLLYDCIMHSPDLRGAIEASNHSNAQFEALSRHASATNRRFPTANLDCCMRFVAVLARRYRGEVCSPSVLDHAVSRILAMCEVAP